METKGLFIVPNTKNGLWAIKYLAKEITKYNLLVKIESKKDFTIRVKLMEKENGK